MGENHMQRLFCPDSVVVFGVTDVPTNLGKNIVDNLDLFGFKGPVYAVGKDGGTYKGRKIHLSVEEIENVPGLAVFLIPARHIPEAMEACGSKGIPYAVIESGGFSEYAGERRALEKEILETARRWNMRFVGPNCISIINMENGLVLPFVPMNPRLMKKGEVSLIAQSGGIVVDSIRLTSAERIGINKLLSIGNKTDLNENDYLEYLISDETTHIIGAYLENIVDGRRFMDIAATTDKPIIILKANTNPVSRMAAQFHTAALAGDDEVADSAFRQAGIHRVQNMKEMMDAFKIFSMPLLKGDRLAVLCRSGGQGVLLADAVHRYGFRLAGFSESFYDLVKKEVRAGVIRMANPLDMGDIFNLGYYPEIAEAALREDEVDGLIISHGYVAPTEIEPTQQLIMKGRELAVKYGKPVIMVLIPEKDQWFSMKETEGCPLFDDSDFAIRALSKSFSHFIHHSKKALLKQYSSRSLGKINLSREPGTFFHPREILQLMSAYGIPLAPWTVVKDSMEGRVAAEKLGYPVVLKIASPQILHKTEQRAVRLNIFTAEELDLAFKEMAGADEYLLQKMMPSGVEVIIGGKQDAEFGSVILFGLGGIFVEVFKDTAMRVSPINEDEAKEMIDAIKGRTLLTGFRGRVPSDTETLANCLVNVSRLLVEHPEISHLDINPLIVMDQGKGCVAVDVKAGIQTV
jgi:acetate---CoA ligase (ADP-forming)